MEERAISFFGLEIQQQRLQPRLGEAIARVLAHGQFILGPEVRELEARLSAFCGARHAVACGNGTDALALVLMAEGVGTGDAVFVPAFTFAATAEVVAWFGAIPFFVDVSPASFTIDPTSLEAAIAAARRSGLRPRAVISVDLFGQPADYDTLLPLAERQRLFLLSDAAQSFGATWRGKRVGRFGRATATSFYPTKPLACYGDGGAIFTDDGSLAARLRSLRAHGEGKRRYDHSHIGMNSRLDSIQAAILLEKLELFEEEIAARQEVARRYAEALGDAVGVPRVAHGATSVWAQYTILSPLRDRIESACRERRIPTAIHYPKTLAQQEAYRHFPSAPGGVPVAKRLAREAISLPFNPYLDRAAQDRIIEVVLRAVRN